LAWLEFDLSVGATIVYKFQFGFKFVYKHKCEHASTQFNRCTI
jgi:hypothetical protein